MDFLKELFNGGAMTYEQLSAAVKSKGLSVVDATGGAYVPKTVRMRSPVMLGKKKTTAPFSVQWTLELLPGFEPGTSSLPRMRSTC